MQRKFGRRTNGGLVQYINSKKQVHIALITKEYEDLEPK